MSPDAKRSHFGGREGQFYLEALLITGGTPKSPADAPRALQEGVGHSYCAGGEEHKVQHVQAAADPSWTIPKPLVLVILEVGAHQPRLHSRPSADPGQAIPGHYLPS